MPQLNGGIIAGVAADELVGTIHGARFGDTPGQVLADGVEATVISWEDNKVIFSVADSQVELIELVSVDGRRARRPGLWLVNTAAAQAPDWSITDVTGEADGVHVTGTGLLAVEDILLIDDDFSQQFVPVETITRTDTLMVLDWPVGMTSALERLILKQIQGGQTRVSVHTGSWTKPTPNPTGVAAPGIGEVDITGDTFIDMASIRIVADAMNFDYTKAQILASAGGSVSDTLIHLGDQADLRGREISAAWVYNDLGAVGILSGQAVEVPDVPMIASSMTAIKFGDGTPGLQITGTGFGPVAGTVDLTYNPTESANIRSWERNEIQVESRGLKEYEKALVKNRFLSDQVDTAADAGLPPVVSLGTTVTVTSVTSPADETISMAGTTFDEVAYVEVRQAGGTIIRVCNTQDIDPMCAANNALAGVTVTTWDATTIELVSVHLGGTNVDQIKFLDVGDVVNLDHTVSPALAIAGTPPPTPTVTSFTQPSPGRWKMEGTKLDEISYGFFNFQNGSLGSQSFFIPGNHPSGTILSQIFGMTNFTITDTELSFDWTHPGLPSNAGETYEIIYHDLAFLTQPTFVVTPPLAVI